MIHWHFPNHSISSFITLESRFPPGVLALQMFLLSAVLDILSAANTGEETDHNTTVSNILTLLLGINIGVLNCNKLSQVCETTLRKYSSRQIFMSPLGSKMESQSKDGLFSCSPHHYSSEQQYRYSGKQTSTKAASNDILCFSLT